MELWSLSGATPSFYILQEDGSFVKAGQDCSIVKPGKLVVCSQRILSEEEERVSVCLCVSGRQGKGEGVQIGKQSKRRQAILPN